MAVQGELISSFGLCFLGLLIVKNSSKEVVKSFTIAVSLPSMHELLKPPARLPMLMFSFLGLGLMFF